MQGKSSFIAAIQRRKAGLSVFFITRLCKCPCLTAVLVPAGEIGDRYLVVKVQLENWLETYGGVLLHFPLRLVIVGSCLDCGEPLLEALLLVEVEPLAMLLGHLPSDRHS
jgi:hypothetical protein